MNPHLLIAIPLLPLVAAVIAGLGGRVIGRAGAHTVTIIGVAVSCVLSMYVLKQLYADGVPTFNGPVYTWALSDGVHIDVGFLIDRLSVLMMAVVTFVSLCVHVYTIGYMRDDPGYIRFFSYISLFTFSMLMLVMSNNFMQLFFGWEAVGVVSYLLIGFWYTRPSAIFANLKAFIVNRIGDFGFIIGIAAVFSYTGSLSYDAAFTAAPHLAHAAVPITAATSFNALTLICICLFIGAMGKSAQVPLHVWLPDSMEGPTPISALIHAATMVTAGIFMVARMSPLFEYSDTALSFVLVIGATTAFFMGLIGVVNNDIKRVIAYSTLSQLGYMTVALGVSAYSAAIFHLMTHAFFKALLFLAAGSVIIGMHHEQDMRKMGGLGKYMPITATTCWIGGLALVATPFFSGFYSKDAIIEAVGQSHRYGSTYAYWCVLLGAYVTSLYTFRLLFMTFHGKERFRHADAGYDHEGSKTVGHEEEQETPAGGAPEDVHGGAHAHATAAAHPEHGRHPVDPHESPWVVTVPLIALAIPSLIVGYFTVGPVLFGSYFGHSIFVLPANNIIGAMAREFHGPGQLGFHGFLGAPFWLMVAGFVTAWACYIWRPSLADQAAHTLGWLRTLLVEKYYFDWINEKIIAPLARGVGFGLWKVGDQGIIDGALVNGSAASIGWLGGVVRKVQSGYLYSYAFWMVIGLAALLGWFLARG
ncbi:MAG TPA: NADH-quinone oxidoreductase subunit L [Steroidobacteraceae bacterium]|nr:NADH-quinone oxidoreductase subunit L [Steroidobacteraceae bacterium]